MRPQGDLDRWILSRLARTIDDANAAIASYRFDQYAKVCYDFFWRDFCDWYLEATKLLLKRDVGITRLRGQVFPWWNRRLVPTFHPAAALRGGERVLGQMREDFSLARQVIDESSPAAAEADGEQLGLFG